MEFIKIGFILSIALTAVGAVGAMAALEVVSAPRAAAVFEKVMLGGLLFAVAFWACFLVAGVLGY